MILYDARFQDNYWLEIVDGIDIVKTYRSLWVLSCMTMKRSVNFYRYVPNLKLIRLKSIRSAIYQPTVLRALLWTGKDIEGNTKTLLDRVYVSEWCKSPWRLWRDFRDYAEDRCDILSDGGYFNYHRPEFLEVEFDAEAWKQWRCGLPYRDSFAERHGNKLYNCNIDRWNNAKATPVQTYQQYTTYITTWNCTTDGYNVTTIVYP